MRVVETTERVRAAWPHRTSALGPALLSVLTSLAGCEQEATPERPSRSAPWRIDEGAESPEPLPATSYFVSPGQHLEFSLPAKYATPRGELHGITGSIEFLPTRLTHARGAIAVPLEQIRMLPGSQEELDRLAKRQGDRPEVARRALAALEGLGTWTEHARRWLGSSTSGESVGSTRTLASEHLASFTLEFAKDLSHPRASAGARRKPEESSGEIRVVDAKVQGTLQLRGYSVERSFPVRLAFHYPGPAKLGDLPDAVEVSFRSHFSVPLAEYDVRPRDAQGVVLATIEDQLGSLVGDVARVSGSLKFERARGRSR